MLTGDSDDEAERDARARRRGPLPHQALLAAAPLRLVDRLGARRADAPRAPRSRRPGPMHRRARPARRRAGPRARAARAAWPAAPPSARAKPSHARAKERKLVRRRCGARRASGRCRRGRRCRRRRRSCWRARRRASPRRVRTGRQSIAIRNRLIGSRALRTAAGRLGQRSRRRKRMKLGVHIGYWGLGLTADEQLKLVQRGGVARLRLGVDRGGLRVRRRDDPRLARAGHRARSSSARRSSRCPAARPR